MIANSYQNFERKSFVVSKYDWYIHRLSFLNEWSIKKINQIVEIAFQFYMITIIISTNWFKVLRFIQRLLNNVTFAIIDRILNEANFDFTFLQIENLRKFSSIDHFSTKRLLRTQLIRKWSRRRYRFRLNERKTSLRSKISIAFHEEKLWRAYSITLWLSNLCHKCIEKEVQSTICRFFQNIEKSRSIDISIEFVETLKNSFNIVNRSIKVDIFLVERFLSTL